MNKSISIISALYLAGCSVAKPLVLNNQINAPKQVLKAYTNGNTRNGTNNFYLIDGFRNDENHPIITDNNNYIVSFMLYALPYNNPLNFNYEVIKQNGTYFVFQSSLMYNFKIGIEIQAESDGEYHNVINLTQAMTLAQDVKTKLLFKSYHLPYDTNDWSNSNDNFNAYDIENTISIHFGGSGALYVEPENFNEIAYLTTLRNDNIYYSFERSTQIVNAKSCWAEPYLFIDWVSEVQTIDAQLATEIINFFKTNLNLFNSYEKKYYTFNYNCSFSEELTAFNDGYIAGLEEGAEGVGTSWIRQVFRAIQAFLDFDFGFFKLGHLLGGVLVIAIVIFIVRWFR